MIRNFISIAIFVTGVITLTVMFINSVENTLLHIIAPILFGAVLLLPLFVARLVFPHKAYTLDQFGEDIVKHKMINYNQIEGCTEFEIERLMKSQQVEVLPEKLDMFFRRFGKIPFNHPSQSGLLYPDNLNNLANLVAQLNNPYWIKPKDIFIVEEPKFGQVVYIKVDDINDNPPVYICEIVSSGWEEGEVMYKSFLEYLEYWVDIAKVSNT